MLHQILCISLWTTFWRFLHVGTIVSWSFLQCFISPYTNKNTIVFASEVMPTQAMWLKIRKISHFCSVKCRCYQDGKSLQTQTNCFVCLNLIYKIHQQPLDSGTFLLLLKIGPLIPNGCPMVHYIAKWVNTSHFLSVTVQT